MLIQLSLTPMTPQEPSLLVDLVESALPSSGLTEPLQPPASAPAQRAARQPASRKTAVGRKAPEAIKSPMTPEPIPQNTAPQNRTPSDAPSAQEIRPPVSAGQAPSQNSSLAEPPSRVAPVEESASRVSYAEHEAVMNGYASILHALISEHREYPQQALLRGEEGTVKLRIVLAGNGGLVDVHALSNAPSHLVAASVEAVRASAPFPPLPTLLGSGQQAFEVSLVYRIQ